MLSFIRLDPAEQLAWLCEEDPDYLISLGHNLHALIEESVRSGRRPTRRCC